MSEMQSFPDAAQIAAQQGVDLNQPAGDVAGGGEQGGAPAPGTGTPPETVQTTTPPAEAENTDTGEQTGGPPDSVPYSRFKEVNDQLRDFKELEGFGYDADSLRQLAMWGAQFDQNPVDSWLSIAKELGDDMPPEVREAVAGYLEGQSMTVQPQQADQDSEPPPWAQELKQRMDDRDAANEQSARAQMLDSIV